MSFPRSQFQHAMKLNRGRYSLLSALLVFAFAIIAYCLTLAPTVTFIDSGELIAAAYTLGVAHPPGTPLYILIAHVFTLFPAGTVAKHVGLCSAIFAALAAATLVVSSAKILPSSLERPNKPNKMDPLQERVDWLLLSATIVPNVLTGLVFSFSRTLWAYATVAEVYTLNTFLLVTIFFLVFSWRRERSAVSAGRDGQPDHHRRQSIFRSRHRYLILAAFVFGLALGVHHVTIAITLPAIAFVILKTAGIRFLTTKQFAYSVLAAVAGLCIYLYLPLAASRSPLVNWGDPRTAEKLWKHVSGWQYQAFFSFSPEKITGQISQFVDIAAVEFGYWGTPVILFLAIAGFYVLWRKAHETLWFLLFVAAADLVIGLNYDIAEDKDAYYLPFFVVWVLFAGVGMRWLISRFPLARIRPSYLAAAMVMMLVIVVETVFVGNLKVSNKSRYFLADDYVENIYRSMEPGSMLLTTDWQVYSPSLYKSVIQRSRSDLVIIDVNQMRRSWYFDYLDRSYPELMAACRDKENAFLDDLRRWEKDPALYVADQSLAKRIDARFSDLVSTILAYQGAKGSAYVTQEIGETFTSIAANRSRNPTFDPASTGPDGAWISLLVENYGLVPEGLVFRLTTGKSSTTPRDIALENKGLREAIVTFGDGDVVKRKIIPVYLKMALSRGSFALSTGDPGRARKDFESALAIDPNFAPAKQAVAQLKIMDGKR